MATIDTSTEREEVKEGKEEKAAYYVLVGGEAHETQGVIPEKRELMHTSLTYVAAAYAQLRGAGVPRSRIITIVQVRDYLEGLKDGQYPKVMYEKECALLLKEGGSDYDFDAVCPSTVWRVVLGLKNENYPKVVPKGKDKVKSLTLAIYSHGDSHPAVKIIKHQHQHQHQEKKEADNAAAAAATENGSSNLMGPPDLKPHLDPLKHEWFVHMPYPNKDRRINNEILSFVATEGSKDAGRCRNKPEYYLYATQLRSIFCSLFQENPKRPVIALLNYCRSGGGIEFLRRSYTRKALGAEKWPLYLMSSCQASHDALVGGLWETWFQHLSKRIPKLMSSDAKDTVNNTNITLGKLFFESKKEYHIKNKYELKDLVKTFAFPSIFGETNNQNAVAVRYDADLAKVICSSSDGNDACNYGHIDGYSTVDR
mmetsp:Transcript_31947/g.51794  ORF Transcript_31947/g.51794 Transcript_31947/m.51794 type:complete len:425 (-) Transcript_31947:140-1414(-)